MKNSLILIFIIIIIIILAVLLGLVYKTNRETFINFENFYTISGSGIVSSLMPIPNSNDNYLSFTAGTSSLTLNNSFICDILIVGGGGGGCTGGGGAGQVIYQTNQTLNSGTYTITIGTGGAGVAPNSIMTAANRGNDGNDSFIQLNGVDVIRARKGGGGAGNTQLATAPNGIYGSTGGNGINSRGTQNTFSAGIVLGFVGGIGTTGNSYGNAGGGGGAGENGKIGIVGYDATYGSGGLGGAGGNGIQISITGTPTYYGGGGAGGTNINNSTNTQPNRPAGGLGGGGAGSRIDREAGLNAIANTGGGGGGSDWETSSPSGSGGSGIVIIRFKEVLGLSAEQSLAATSETTLNLNTELLKYPSGIPVNSSGNAANFEINLNYDTDTNDLYTIGFTSYRQYYDDNTPVNLFNGNIDNTQNIYTSQNTDGIGGSFSGLQANGYNKTTGDYLGSSIVLRDGQTDIRGEAVYISSANSFVLRKINFVAINGNEYNAPGKWRIYGFNRTSTANQFNLRTLPVTISNLTLIDNFTATGLETTAYKNRYSLYERIPSPGSPEPFNSYIFIFTATAKKTARDIDSSSYRTHFRLNFAEISLFGHPDERAAI